MFHNMSEARPPLLIVFIFAIRLVALDISLQPPDPDNDGEDRVQPFDEEEDFEPGRYPFSSH